MVGHHHLRMTVACLKMGLVVVVVLLAEVYCNHRNLNVCYRSLKVVMEEVRTLRGVQAIPNHIPAQCILGVKLVAVALK